MQCWCDLFLNYQPFRTLNERHTSDCGLAYLPKLIGASVFFIGFFFIPTIIFANVENWPYTTALYYCFISLSTIGFGDYVPKPASSTFLSFLYVAYIMLWIFSGLVWMSVFLNRISSKTERIVDTHVDLGVRSSRSYPGEQNLANNRDDSDVWKTSDGRRVDEKNVASTAKPLFPKNITERGDTSKYGNVRRAPEYLYGDFFRKCCWFLFTSVSISLVLRVIQIYGWIT